MTSPAAPPEALTLRAPGWLGWLQGWSGRLLADPRFQRWAAAFPLTRPIARRRARQLFDLCAGFVYAQVLYACVQGRLFEMLRPGPLSLDALALRLDLPQDRAALLCEAAVSLRLLARRGAWGYALGPQGAALLGNPGLAEMIRHHHLLYADLRDPLALLRGAAGPRALAVYWPYATAAQPAALEESEVAAYSDLMAASQPLVAGAVLDAYRLDRHRCLLDVGGGDGGFLIAAAARAPGLRLHLFDLPAVAARAGRRFAAAGLAARAVVSGGDFRTDPLPAGADVASLVRVLHDHDDATALVLLGAIRAALPRGGRMLLAEPMAGTRGAEPMGAAYFGFYLAAMGSGRPRTPQACMALLTAAGFARCRLLPTAMPLLVRVILAEAP